MDDHAVLRKVHRLRRTDRAVDIVLIDLRIRARDRDDAARDLHLRLGRPEARVNILRRGLGYLLRLDDRPVDRMGGFAKIDDGPFPQAERRLFIDVQYRRPAAAAVRNDELEGRGTDIETRNNITAASKSPEFHTTMISGKTGERNCVKETPRKSRRRVMVARPFFSRELPRPWPQVLPSGRHPFSFHDHIREDGGCHEEGAARRGRAPCVKCPY